MQSKKLGIIQLTQKVKDTYSDLENQLTRPERSDLFDAKELINIFLLDLEIPDLSFPIFPKDLVVKFESQETPKISMKSYNIKRHLF